MITGFLLRKTLLKGDPDPFIIELPPYRKPILKNIWMNVREKINDYVKKAGTLIFAASVIVWFLQAFTPQMKLSTAPAESLFAYIGHSFAFVFTPAGFGDWRLAVSLLAGFAAKEAVLSTVGILFSNGTDLLSLTNGLQSALSPSAALAFLVFVLLYTPCMATLAAMQREFKSWKWTVGAVSWQLLFAWTASFLVFQLGRLFL